MASIIPAVGEDKLLAFAMGVATPGNQILKLFTNNAVLDDANTAATFTEMSTLDYVAKTLTKTSWVIAQNLGISEATYASQTFAFTTGTAVLVYGYFIVDATTGVLLGAETFTTPKSIAFTGDQISIIPRVTLSKV